MSVARVMRKVAGRIRRAPSRSARFLVRRLDPPRAWVGYRWLEDVDVREHVARARSAGRTAGYELVHPAERADNPLPVNVSSRDELPADRGWWGYSFRDVPAREGGPTFVATVPDARVVPYLDPSNGEFQVCVVTPDDRVLDLREMAFRDLHPRELRSRTPRRLDRATWILERVYHNHSHWLTAHLPKVLLARQRGLLAQTILPGRPTTDTIEQSLRGLGIGPGDAPRLERIEPLRVGELTVMGTDRFRPELLRSVRDAFGGWIEGDRSRRVWISRERAGRRRLLNEDEVWPLLERAGFEKVFMEELSLEEQARIMGRADAVAAPHGAGLTNVVFCPPGTAVVEIADLAFPNPNFYATSAAMGHRYWIVRAEMRGGGHPLERDLWVDPDRVAAAVEAL